MSFTYVGNNSAATNGATSLLCNRPTGVGVGDLMVAVYAFEGVAAGSGPWIIPNTGQFPSNVIGPAENWIRVGWQAPSGSGVGIEIWAAIHGSGTTQQANFGASYAAVTVVAAWSGAYAPGGTIFDGAVRACVTAQVTGNQPAAPLVFAFANELVIACGGDEMTAAKFGTPAGYTNRVDVARAGAGTAEATLADALVLATGGTGPIIFPNNAAAGGTLGATATLAIRPTTVAPLANEVLTAGFPQFLDLPDGYQVIWDAVDVTGAHVAGVTVGQVSIFGTLLGSGAGDVTFGPFKLVPGPGA